MEEQGTHKPLVVGSSPTLATRYIQESRPYQRSIFIFIYRLITPQLVHSSCCGLKVSPPLVGVRAAYIFHSKLTACKCGSQFKRFQVCRQELAMTLWQMILQRLL